MSFEESLIRHASPTLASIKVANLYSFRFQSAIECIETLRSFNALMNKKGIYIELLKNTAKYLFCKYKHCREIYIKVYREGRRFADMLVSA